MSWRDSDSKSETDEWNTPAIARDGFSFKDDKFYVTVDYHTHTRKDAAELYALLTYTPPPLALTKAGKVAKRQPKDTHKDEEAHFYEAQLVHYGMKPLKTREPAKKRLLAGFGGPDGKSLEVPNAILELEVALRKEWKELDAKMEEGRELIRAKEKERKAKYRGAREKAEVDRLKSLRMRSLRGRTKYTARKMYGRETILVESDDEPEIVAVNTNSKMSKTQMLEKITNLTESQAHGLLKKIFENVPAAEKLFQAEFNIIAKGKGYNPNGKKPLEGVSLYNFLYNLPGSIIHLQIGNRRSF